MGEKKLKLFTSYSHRDNTADRDYIEQFKKHITPLKDNGLIEDWYDREIFSGEDYQNKIDDNLGDADILCLFISANFLSSNNCKKEKKKALELRKKRGTVVIPIILSHCGWKDDGDISRLSALPTDGKPVLSFGDSDEAWLDVYEGLKRVIEKEMKVRHLKLSEKFEGFLQDTEMLEKAHSQKESVCLDDIFVCPELDEYGDLKEYKRTISSGELLESVLEYPKFAIAGEAQSGKTSLCKMIFRELRKKGLVPVYVCDREVQLRGRIENKISSSFSEQYEGVHIREIDNERIVPIIDDFHLAKHKEKHIRDLSKHSCCVLIVDDIFGLDIAAEELISAFTYFSLRELKPSLRYQLVKKWVSLTDKESGDYSEIDRETELVDSTLGKNIAKGIMPAYPFHILATLVTYRTLVPLDQEITSQGYCYQALIYFYLRRQEVRNDEIDIYMNFLTELAFYLCKEKKRELPPEGFSYFMDSYSKKYVFAIKRETFLGNLNQIVSADSLNNYSFRYPYFYYFFVGKYIAEHIRSEDEQTRREIEDMQSAILDNLHVDENAYITIFVAHHLRDVSILDDITVRALMLFEKYEPATLTREEVQFFDEQSDKIIRPGSLLSKKTTPEEERAKRLQVQDEEEQSRREDTSEEDPSEAKELRRGIKTVEVMGCIIKNRVGSLGKAKLEEIFEEGMNVYLRILSSFFELIESEENQKSIVGFISERLERFIDEKGGSKPDGKERERILTRIFWNLNFFVVFGYINKVVHSLGSDKLLEITKKVCDETGTPASFAVKHGMLMWYNKNLRIDEIVEGMRQNSFSNVAKTVLELMVVNHCSLHQIGYKNRQKIVAQLGISKTKLFTKES